MGKLCNRTRSGPSRRCLGVSGGMRWSSALVVLLLATTIPAVAQQPPQFHALQLRPIGATPFLTMAFLAAHGLLPYLSSAMLVQAAASHKWDSKTTVELLELSKSFQQQGQKMEALEALDLAIQRDPQNYLSLFRRAVLYLSMGKTSSAISDLDAVLQLKPGFDQALLQRGKLYMRSCQLGKALEDFQTLASHGSASVEIKSEAQQLITECRESEGAAASARQLMESAGAKTEAQLDSAIDLLGKVLQTCSLDASLRMLRAEAFSLKGEFAQAIGDYTRATTIQPDNIPALLKMAELHSKLGELQGAIGNLKSCIHLDPEHPKCVKMFRRLRKLEKAIEFAEKEQKMGRLRNALGEEGLDEDGTGKVGAISLMKELDIKGAVYNKVLAMICRCNLRLKRKETALKRCDEAVRADENNPEVLADRAEVNMLLEEYEDALRDYNKAKEASGGSPSDRIREGLQKAQRELKRSKQRDYYKVLGVDRDADKYEIKRAYRRLAKQHHPDKQKDDADKKKAEKKMAEINQAYEVLSNPELKQQFDSGRDPNDPHGGFGDGGGGNPFAGGHPIFFQGGSPFGGGNPFGGGGGGGFQFHFN